MTRFDNFTGVLLEMFLERALGVKIIVTPLAGDPIRLSVHLCPMFLQLEYVTANGAARFAQHDTLLLVTTSDMVQKGLFLFVVGGTMFALMSFVAKMHESKVFVQIEIPIKTFAANVTPMHQSRYDSVVFS